MKKKILWLTGIIAMVLATGMYSCNAPQAEYNEDEPYLFGGTRAIVDLYDAFRDFNSDYVQKVKPADKDEELLQKIIFATVLGHYIADGEEGELGIWSPVYQSWRAAGKGASLAEMMAAGDWDEQVRQHADDLQSRSSTMRAAINAATYSWGGDAVGYAENLRLILEQVNAKENTGLSDLGKIAEIYSALGMNDMMFYVSMITNSVIYDALVNTALARTNNNGYFDFQRGVSWLIANYPEKEHMLAIMQLCLPVIAGGQAYGYVEALGEFIEQDNSLYDGESFFDYVDEADFQQLLVCLGLAHQSAIYWTGGLPPLSIDPPTLNNVPITGGTYYITITSPGPWQANASNLITLNPSSGRAGTTVIEIVVARNNLESHNEYKHTVTFTADNEQAVLEIFQKSITPPIPITVFPSTIRTFTAGGSFSIEVTCDGDWQVGFINNNAANFNPSSGRGNATVRLNLYNNWENHFLSTIYGYYIVFFNSVNERAELRIYKEDIIGVD